MRVVLTGAAGEIGRRVARRLLADGHTVIGLDKQPVALPEPAVTHVVDLSNDAAVRTLLEGQTVDAVVTAAGWYTVGALEDCSPAAFRDHLEANLVAAHTVINATLPAVRRQRGRIVIVGSTTGSVPLPYHGAYSAAKAGLDGYATALRREMAEHGVTVSLIEPGPSRTGLNEQAAAARPDTGPYADVYDQFDGYSPESTTPAAVAETVVQAVTVTAPRGRYRVGRRARWLPVLLSVLPTRLADRLVRAGLPDRLLGRLIDR